MKRLFIFLLIPLLSFAQDILISIDDNSGQKDEIISVPINISGVTGNEILAYEMQLSYSHQVIEYQNVSTQDCNTQSWGAPLSVEKNLDTLNIGAFGWTELENDGALINVNFKLVGEPGERCPIKIEYAELNGGSLECSTQSGTIEIVTSAESLVANFSATPLNGYAPLEVNFQDLSKGDINLWHWDFGDGKTSNQKHPTHIYNDPGNYTVKLHIESETATADTVFTDYIRCLPAENDSNLIKNPSFSNGTMDFWERNLNDGSTTQFQIIESDLDNDYCLKIKRWKKTESTEVRVWENISVKKNYRYKLTFWAKSPTNSDMRISLHEMTSFATWYGLWYELSLTNDWREYSISFICNTGDDLARFDLFLGGDMGELFLDKFMLLEEYQTTGSKTELFRVTNSDTIFVRGDRMLPPDAKFGFYGNNNNVAYATPQNFRIIIPQPNLEKPFTNYWIEGDIDFFNSAYYNLSGAGHEFLYNSQTGVTDGHLLNNNSILENSGFESGQDFYPWFVEDHFYASSPAEIEITEDCAEGDYAIKVTPSTSKKDEPYALQIKQNIEIQQDSCYQLTFWAKSSVQRSIIVDCHKETAPYTEYGPYARIAINQNWQKYDLYFSSLHSDLNGRFAFLLGEMLGDVWLDDINLHPIKYQPLLSSSHYSADARPTGEIILVDISCQGKNQKLNCTINCPNWILCDFNEFITPQTLKLEIQPNRSGQKRDGHIQIHSNGVLNSPLDIAISQVDEVETGLESKNSLPGQTLLTAYPNPFNPVTNISYQLNVNTLVKLSVYEITGKKIADLVNEKQNAGYYQLSWDGSDLASGVYIICLNTDINSFTKRILLIK